MATCRGIDISAYQGPQDWAAHKRDGVTFAFAKATEGQRSRDKRFAAHIASIKAAGLVPGAYHFAWPNQDVKAESANYIGAVRPYAGRGFTHWLDLERYSDGRNYAGRSSAQIKAWAQEWIKAVQAAFPGQRVGVYTSGDDIAAGRVPADIPLWYPAYPWGPASYSKAEAAAQPRPYGRAPIIWQFTSQPHDRSIAYLSAAAFRAWAAGDTTEEDPLASMTKKDIFDAVWGTDALPAPTTSATGKTNPTWTAQSVLGDVVNRVRAIEVAEKGQTAAIAALAKLAGKEVDTSAVIAAVREAIADAVVNVDVNITGKEA